MVAQLTLQSPIVRRKPFLYRDGIHLDFACNGDGGFHYIKTPGLPPIAAPFSTLFNFVRGTSAARRAASGLLELLSPNIPRVEYNGAGFQRGLYIEDGGSNAILSPSNLSHANWTKTNVTISPLAVPGPLSGTMGAMSDKIVETAVAANHELQQGGHSFTLGQPYTLSALAAPGELEWLRVAFPSGAFGSTYQFFNLRSGLMGSAAGGAVPFMEKYANGFWRCGISKVATATTPGVNIFPFALSRDGATINHMGDGVSGLYLCGAQNENYEVRTSFMPSSDVAAFTRTADFVSRAVGTEVSPLGGTMSIECAVATTTTSRRVAIFSGATGADRWGIRQAGSIWQAYSLSTVGPNGIAINGGQCVPDVLSKIACSFKQDDSQFATDGALWPGDLTCDMLASFSVLRLGFDASGGTFINGPIRNFHYDARFATGAEVQLITRL